jgi:uncharacterized protein
MPSIEQAKSWYAQNDPVHGFDHIQRVYRMAERLAQAEGADLEIVRAAALLHDAKGPVTGASRSDHQLASAEFAQEILTTEGWTVYRIEAVLHCIRAHRFRDDREQPETIEAKVLFDADKLDAIGAIGAVRAIAYAVLDTQNLFVMPSKQFICMGEKELEEPHTPYHEHLFKLNKLKDRMFTETGRKFAQARHDYLEGFFAQLHAELMVEA